MGRGRVGRGGGGTTGSLPNRTGFPVRSSVHLSVTLSVGNPPYPHSQPGLRLTNLFVLSEHGAGTIRASDGPHPQQAEANLIRSLTQNGSSPVAVLGAGEFHQPSQEDQTVDYLASHPFLGGSAR